MAAGDERRVAGPLEAEGALVGLVAAGLARAGAPRGRRLGLVAELLLLLGRGVAAGARTAGVGGLGAAAPRGVPLLAGDAGVGAFLGGVAAPPALGVGADLGVAAFLGGGVLARAAAPRGVRGAPRGVPSPSPAASSSSSSSQAAAAPARTCVDINRWNAPSGENFSSSATSIRVIFRRIDCSR